ncbi:MAG: TonB-dependent receptor [Bacteroidetes bacterium]|nr:MAG: TonB-dependent receptor [Bacteroidota bacterium]
MKAFAAILTILFALISIESQAQLTQSVRGTVFDRETKVPITGAKIQIFTSDSTKLLRTLTDLDGNFEIKEVPIGKHDLRASYLSYQTSSVTIVVITGKETVLEIPLIEKFQEAQEVQVVGRKKGETINELAIVSAQQFSVEETDRYAGSRSDPARMASNFAGVQGADDSRNDIIVRGNSPLGIVYRIEGVDIPNPSHFAISGSTGGPVSILNNKLLGNSDFFMSAFPAEYGNSISGVFDLKLRNGNNKRHEFTGQFGFLGTEFLLEGPLSSNGKSSYLIMGRYSTLRLFQVLGIQIGTDAVPEYGDAAFKFNWKLAKGGNLSWFGIGGKSNIAIKISDLEEYSTELYGEGDRDQYFGTSMGVSGLVYKKSINEKSFLTNTLAYSLEEQHSKHDFLLRHLDTVQENNQEIYRIIVDSIYQLMGYQFKTQRLSNYISLNHKFNTRHLIKFGANVEYQWMNMNDSVLVTDHSQFVNRWDFNGGALLVQPFVQWRWRITEDMDFTSGLHAQYYSLSKSFSPVEPRVGWKWRFKKGQAIFAGAGLHSQTQPLYTYSYHGDSLGGPKRRFNQGMDFTKSIHQVIGYQKNFSKNLQIKTEAYYQYLFQIPVTYYPSAFSLLNQGSGFARIFPDSLVNEGTGRNYGIELTVQKFFDKSFFFLFTASLYDSKYKGQDGIERNSSYNGTYTLNLLGGKEFKLSEKQSLSIGIKTTVAGGKRYGFVNLDETRKKYELVFIDSAFNERQFRDYFRFDLKVNWKYNARNMTHEIGLDLVNLFNTRNLLGLAFAPDLANPTAEPIAEKTQLGFLPLFYYRLDLRLQKRK